MDVRTLVKRLPVLQALPAAERESLIDYGLVEEYHPGDLIWERGEAAERFTFLIQGQVRLAVVQDKPHREFLIAMVEAPGSLACGPAVCGLVPYCCQAVCTHRTCVLSVSRSALLDDQPSLSGLVLSQIAARGMTLCRRLREVGGARVEERVAAVLLRMADERGTPGREGVKLPATLSRRDLAGLSGCATETLIRVLARFEERGAVLRGRRGLVVVPEILAAMVRAPDDAEPPSR